VKFVRRVSSLWERLLKNQIGSYTTTDFLTSLEIDILLEHLTSFGHKVGEMLAFNRSGSCALHLAFFSEGTTSNEILWGTYITSLTSSYGSRFALEVFLVEYGDFNDLVGLVETAKEYNNTL